MKRKKMELLFELAEELYAEEQKKRGYGILPYAWARNNETGRFLAFSVHSKLSDKVEAKLKEII